MEGRRITGPVVDAAIEVHRALGPGLRESTYEECVCHELFLRGVPFVRQIALPVSYKGVQLERSYRVDVVVSSCLVLELKSVTVLEPVHTAQLLTYMKLGGWRLGLLINFNVPLLKDGIRRLIL